MIVVCIDSMVWPREFTSCRRVDQVSGPEDQTHTRMMCQLTFLLPLETPPRRLRSAPGKRLPILTFVIGANRGTELAAKRVDYNLAIPWDSGSGCSLLPIADFKEP